MPAGAFCFVIFIFRRLARFFHRFSRPLLSSEFVESAPLIPFSPIFADPGRPQLCCEAMFSPSPVQLRERSG